MGEIYTARHRLLDEVRVVKVVRLDQQDNAQLQARFVREARACVRLRHPNIAQIFDFSLDKRGVGYLVMELISGVNLSELLRGQRTLPAPLVLEIGAQALQALDFLHQHDFVHRDVSPDNLMVTTGLRGEPVVKLIDLGLAKSPKGSQQITQAGMFLGKMSYASPEHFGGRDGKAQIDERSDLYSLGIVLYQLLTGELPILGADFGTLLAGHLFHPPRDFTETDPDERVPVELRKLVLATLAKAADERPQSAHWLLKALEKIRPTVGRIDLEGIPPLISAARREGEQVGSSTQARIGKTFPIEPTPHDRAMDAILDAETPSGETTMSPDSTLVVDLASSSMAETSAAEPSEQRAGSSLEDSRSILPGELGRHAATVVVDTAASRRIDAELEELRTLLEQRQLDVVESKIAELPTAAVDEDSRVLELKEDLARYRSQEASLAEARVHLAAGDFEAARRVIATARELEAPSARLRELEEEERTARRARVTELLKGLAAHLDRKDWTEAKEILASASTIDATHPELRSWKEGLEQAIERQQREEAERQEILAAFYRHLETGELSKGRQALAEARSLGVPEGAIQALEGELESRGHQLHAQRQLTALTEPIRQRDWAAVDLSLKSARSLGVDPDEIAKWERLAASEKEREHREAEQQSALEAAKKLLQQGNLEAAEQKARAAAALEADAGELRRLGAELEKHKARRAGTTQELATLPGAIRQGDLSEASRIFREAEKLDPRHPQLSDWKRQIDDAQRRQQLAERQAAALAQELTTIETLRSRRGPWIAFLAVRRARRRFGDPRQLRELGAELRPQLLRRGMRNAGIAAAAAGAAVMAFLLVTWLGRGLVEPQTTIASGPEEPEVTSPLAESAVQAPPPPQTSIASHTADGSTDPVPAPSEVAEDTRSASQVADPLENQEEEPAKAAGPVTPENDPSQVSGKDRRELPDLPPPPPPQPLPEAKGPAVSQRPESRQIPSPSQEEAKPPDPVRPPVVVPEPAPEPATTTDNAQEAVQQAPPPSSGEQSRAMAKHPGFDPRSVSTLEKAIERQDVDLVRLFVEGETEAWANLAGGSSTNDVENDLGDLLVAAARKGDARLVSLLATQASFKRKARKEAQEILIEAMRSGNTDLVKAFRKVPVPLDRDSSTEAKKLLYYSHHRGSDQPLVQAISALLELDPRELEELLAMSAEDLEKTLNPPKLRMGH
jgi:serine/threonine protein kinase